MENQSGISRAGEFLSRRFAPLFCVAAAALPVCYALWTSHVWDDYLITFKFSQNLCEGRGLVYEPGVRTHGFTSPLGVLLPSLCYLAVGRGSWEGALWLFRLCFCVPAFVGGGVFLIKTVGLRFPGRRCPPVCAGLLYLFEAKSVIFSVNGMETAFMLFFLSWALYLMEKGIGAEWPLVGVAWAGLMWTRPDSCVYVAALVAAYVVFPVSSRRTMSVGVLKASLVTIVLYLPWFSWAWWYYGTPVPHTVTAKSAIAVRMGLHEHVSRMLACLPERLGWVFAPPYPRMAFSMGEWPVLLVLFCFIAGAVAFSFWMFQVRRPGVGARASLMFFLLMLYVALMPFPYPWYFPPLAMLGIAALVEAAWALSGCLVHASWRRWFAPSALLCVFVIMAVTLGLVARQMKLQQEVIETGTRKKIGEWLKAEMAPGDRVYLECLGYIGYFSGARMLDFPGLASPEVTRLIRSEKADFVTLVKFLNPEWIVLRPFEVVRMRKLPYFNERYTLAKEFDATRELRGHAYIPGESYLLYDAVFEVFHRTDAPR